MAVCIRCRKGLSSYQVGNLCFSCQEAVRQSKMAEYDKEHEYYDAEDIAELLGLKNAKSVKRLVRKGKIPGKIPEIRKFLWPKETIDNWIKSGALSPTLTNEQAQATLIALQKGISIPGATSYGYDPEGVVDACKQLGYLPGKPKRRDRGL